MPKIYKMKASWDEGSQLVSYDFRIGEDLIPLNDKIGQAIQLNYKGEIRCIHCDRPTNKSFSQGYCFPCFKKLAETDSCIIRPHECHHHLGTCRDNKFAEKHCFIPHVVYLANSSGLKVGITRAHQKTTRWADQGASQAIVLAEVPNRKKAGEIELELSEHLNDKTNWRKMLSLDINPIDLEAKKKEILEFLDEDDQEFAVESKPVELKYPADYFPDKIKSHNLEKEPELSGVLKGIKGQYLIFEEKVINIRKYQGYICDFKAS